MVSIYMSYYSELFQSIVSSIMGMLVLVMLVLVMYSPIIPFYEMKTPLNYRLIQVVVVVMLISTLTSILFNPYHQDLFMFPNCVFIWLLQLQAA
jgi:hypothetical protein